MILTFASLIAGSFISGIALVAFCCIRVGAQYDQWLLSHPPELNGKEDARYDTESDAGQGEVFRG